VQPSLRHTEDGDAEASTEQDAQRRRQPALIHRVANEEEQGDHEDAGAQRSRAAHADPLLPLDARARRSFGRCVRERRRS
jgi:hypothetical protein